MYRIKTRDEPEVIDNYKLDKAAFKLDKAAFNRSLTHMVQ